MPVDDEDAHNRGELRKMYRAVGIASALAVLLAVLAARSPGWRRLAWGIPAATTGLAAGWSFTVGTALAYFSRLIEERPPPSS